MYPATLILENHRELMVCVLGNKGLGSETLCPSFMTVSFALIFSCPNMRLQIKVGACGGVLEVLELHFS